MSVKVRITNSKHFGDAYHDLGEVEGQTVWECFECIIERFPDIEKELFTELGNLKSDVCILLNKNTTDPDTLTVRVKAGDELDIYIVGGG